MTWKKLLLALSISSAVSASLSIASSINRVSEAPQAACGPRSWDAEATSSAASGHPIPIAARLLDYPTAGVVNHLSTLTAPKRTAAIVPSPTRKLVSVNRITREAGPCGDLTLWRIVLSDGSKYFFARRPVRIEVGSLGVTAFFEPGLDSSIFPRIRK